MLRFTLVLALLLRYFPELINSAWARWDVFVGRALSRPVDRAARYLDRYYRVGRHRVTVDVEPLYRPLLARAAGPVPRALSWAAAK